MNKSGLRFVLPALAVALSAAPLWAQAMHYPFPVPAQTKPPASGAQGIGSIYGGAGSDPSGSESTPATNDPFNGYYNTPPGVVSSIGSGNISSFYNNSPASVGSPASPSPKKTCKMYNLGDMGLLGENRSLAQDIAQNLPTLFPSSTCWQAVLLDKVLVVQQTPEIIAQVDEFLKKLQETLPAGKDKRFGAEQGRGPADDSETIKTAIKEAVGLAGKLAGVEPGQGKWTIQVANPKETSRPPDDKSASNDTSKNWPRTYSASGPWTYSGDQQKLTPEEEKLQRFWHDYYDSMGRYYRSLDHIDWVTYYKNHGYQINTGGDPGCASSSPCSGPNRIKFAPVFVTPGMQWAVPDSGVNGPPSGQLNPPSSVCTQGSPPMSHCPSPAGQIDVMPSPSTSGPPVVAPSLSESFGTQRDSFGEAVIKIYKLSDLGLTSDDGKLVQWIVDILPRVDVDNKIGPLYLPEKGLLVVCYTADVIAQVDWFLKKAKEAFAATKEIDVATNPKAPTDMVTSVHCLWNKQLTLANQNCAGSKPLVGITGRVYLFGLDLKQPYAAEAGAKIVAEMSYVRPDGKTQKSRYDFANENLEACLKQDVLGWGYNIPLPWPEYQEGIKEITIQVSLIPACGDTIIGSPSTFVVKRPVQDASAPVPIMPINHDSAQCGKAKFDVNIPGGSAKHESERLFKVYKLHEFGDFNTMSGEDAAQLGQWIAKSLVTSISSASWDVSPVYLPSQGLLIVKSSPSVVAQVEDFLKSLKSALSPSEAPPSRPNAKTPVSFPRRNVANPDAASPSPSIPGNPSADELQPASPYPQESKANPWGADVLAKALALNAVGPTVVKPSAAAPERIVLIRARSGDTFSGSKVYRNGEWVSEFPTGIMMLVRDADTQKVVADIEADRMMSWCEGEADPLAQDNTADKKRLFYLAGRVEIRQPGSGDEAQTIQASEAYYDLNRDLAVAISGMEKHSACSKPPVDPSTILLRRVDSEDERFALMSGRESDFGWVTGVLRSEKGEWIVDYFQDDDFGGKLTLKNVQPGDIQNGDLVCVMGMLMNKATGAYAVSTIHMIERAHR